MANGYNCTAEMHNRCSNSSLCHLCDGVRLFKDPVAEKKEKMKVREENKRAQKSALLKTHQKEKKEGMGFEKRVASQWNQKFGGGSKKKVAKPRLDMLVDEPREEETDRPKNLSHSTMYSGGIKNPPASSRPQKPNPQPRPEAQRQFNSGAFWHSKGDIKLEHALLECKERGTTNSRGEKQITIPKLWIEKQEKEAFQEQRPYWYIPFGYKGDDGIYLVKSYDHEMEMIYEMRQQREEIERLKNELEALRNEVQ